MRLILFILFFMPLSFFTQDTLIIVKIPPHEIKPGGIIDKRIQQRLIDRAVEIRVTHEESIHVPPVHFSGVTYIQDQKYSTKISIPTSAIQELKVHDQGMPAKFGDTTSMIVEVKSVSPFRHFYFFH